MCTRTTGNPWAITPALIALAGLLLPARFAATAAVAAQERIPLRHAEAQALADRVKALAPPPAGLVRVEAVDSQNSLVVVGTPAAIGEVKAFVAIADRPGRRVQAHFETYVIRPGVSLAHLFPIHLGRLFSFHDPQPDPSPLLRYDVGTTREILGGLLEDRQVRAGAEVAVVAFDGLPASVASSHSNWGVRERFEIGITPRIIPRDGSVGVAVTTSIGPDAVGAAEPYSAPETLALPTWRVRGAPHQDRLIWIAREATEERGGILVVAAFTVLPERQGMGGP